MHDLFNYIPKSSHSLLSDLIGSEKLIIKIVNSRKTKHGDFRSLVKGKYQITVNKTNNKYRFLITLIHELAHFRINKSYGNSVNPHGNEWKKMYKYLMLPFLNNLIFPDEILKSLAIHMINPKASTDSDTNLVISLQKYDQINDEKMFLFEIPEGELFYYNKNKLFKKMSKRRKRYICKELSSGKKYLFSPVARIKLIENENSCS